MSLAEKIKSRPVPKEKVTVCGDEFLIVGKSKRERGALFAKSRRKDGSINGDLLEGVLLTACVADPSDGKQLFSEAREWDDIGTDLTGPLFSHVMRVLGMDKDDLGPKDSDATES